MQAAVGDLTRTLTRDCEGPPCTREGPPNTVTIVSTHRGLRTRGVWHDVVDSLLNKTLKHMELDLHFLSCAYNAIRSMAQLRPN